MHWKQLLVLCCIANIRIFCVESRVVPVPAVLSPSAEFVQILITFFKDTRTIHVYDDEPKGREGYIKIIQNLDLFSIRILKFDERSERNLISAGKNQFSKTDGFILCMTRSEQYFRFLAFVRSINPRAKVMVFGNVESFDVARDSIIIGWNRFNLLKVVHCMVLLESIYWLLYNPFEKKLYNLDKVEKVDTFLEDFQSCKDVRGFPVKIFKPADFQPHSAREVGLKILETATHRINFSDKFITDKTQCDVDTNPTAILVAIPKGAMFMYPLSMIKAVAVVPKNYRFKMDNERKIPKELESWNYRYFVQFSTNLIILTIFSKICRSLNHAERVSESELSNMLLVTVGIASCLAVAPLKNRQLQYITISMMFPAMVLYNLYTGAMYELFNFQPNGDIESLSELASSDLRIFASPIFMKLLDNTVTDVTITAIVSRLETFTTDQEMMHQNTKNPGSAFIQPWYQAELIVQTNYNSKGYNLFHIVPEPVHEFYLALIGRRNYPLLWKINELTARMIEAGIVQHEQALLYYNIHLQRLARVKNGHLKEPEFRAINLGDVLERFMWTSCGLIGGVEMLVLEIIYFYYGPTVKRFAATLAGRCVSGLVNGFVMLKLVCSMPWKKPKKQN